MRWPPSFSDSQASSSRTFPDSISSAPAGLMLRLGGLCLSRGPFLSEPPAASIFLFFSSRTLLWAWGVLLRSRTFRAPPSGGCPSDWALFELTSGPRLPELAPLSSVRRRTPALASEPVGPCRSSLRLEEGSFLDSSHPSAGSRAFPSAGRARCRVPSPSRCGASFPLALPPLVPASWPARAPLF